MKGNRSFPGLITRSGNDVTGILGARMTERESMTQVREGQGAARGKGGKGKAVIKRSKIEAPSQQQESQVEGRRSAPEGSEGREAQDPQLISRIQQRAYLLFEAGGFVHGRALEHWLEAERQITGSWDRPER
jgi:hypothetical protein